MALPEEKREASQGQEGLWLEIFCPDGACLTDEERGKVPERAEAPRGKDKGYWLKLFCPDDTCQIDNGSKAP